MQGRGAGVAMLASYIDSSVFKLGNRGGKWYPKISLFLEEFVSHSVPLDTL